MIDNIVREDVQHARFDFGREAFIIPTATTDDELLAVIGKVSSTVLDAYTAVARALPEQFGQLAHAHYGETVDAS